MSTPRKHWFRVADSILGENWDPATTHTVVRLMAFLNSRWAREGLSAEAACEVTIDGRSALWITGERREHLALKRILALPELANISTMHTAIVVERFQSGGEHLLARGLGVPLERFWDDSRATLERLKKPLRVRLKWPKWAEFQDLAAPKMPSPHPLPPPPPKSKNKSYETPAAPATTTKANGSHPVGSHPPLTDPQWGELIAWADQMVAAGKLTSADPRWLSDQVERCADHWAAKGKKISRWPAAVRNWCRKSQEFAVRDRPKTNGIQAPQSVNLAWVDQQLERVRRESTAWDLSTALAEYEKFTEGADQRGCRFTASAAVNRVFEARIDALRADEAF